MGANFIPYFHFDNPADKLKPEWCMKVVNYHYYNQANINLLAGKKVRQIDEYATGEFDMLPYKRMFKSMQKKLQNAPKNPDGSFTDWSMNIDTIGIDWEPLAIIPSILNSAIENMMRLPMDVTCEAQDSLAMKKKKEDIDFLKNKPIIEAELQPLADEMGVGKVDLGTTKNSSIKFSDAPMGLDLNDPEHEQVFTQLFYSLKVTTAFEKFLKQWGGIKNIDMIRRLLVTDHFKYGVAAARGYTSSMTGLPDVDYIHPSRVYTPYSELPDKSDRTHEYTDYWMTVMEMFNNFGNEICDEETLERMINGKGENGVGTGYCSCGKNGPATHVDAKYFSTFKVNLKYFEIKSVDWVGVKRNGSSKRGATTFTQDGTDCDSKIWGQNTYGFFWLTGTRYVFGIHRLDYSHRTKGKEAFQNFSTHIYKSQPKSAVELCITENKNAQIAAIKFQHSLIKSGPQGKYFNLRFMRNALSGLKNENSLYTLQDVINLYLEHNIMVGDTEGFDGKNDGQLKPFEEIPGGLRAEVNGYWTTIINARANCGYITGINQQLTGQSPEELIGLQQLQINSGLNAINYCNIGIQNQFEGLYNNWAYYLQSAIEAGGQTKKAVINYIGEEDTEILEGLDEAPLHEITTEIKFGENYAMMQSFMQQFNFLKSQGVITTVDEYLLEAVDNPKEKFQKMYFIEQRFKKEQERIRAEQYASQQALLQQQGQNQLQTEGAKTEGDIKKVYAEGDVEAKLLELGNQLGLGSQQMDGIIKKQLQKERNDAQRQKAIESIIAKENAKKQTALV